MIVSVTISDRTELQNILRTKSVKFGAFTLASGQTSDVYVDCKPTTFDPRAMRLIGLLFIQKMQDKNVSAANVQKQVNYCRYGASIVHRKCF